MNTPEKPKTKPNNEADQVNSNEGTDGNNAAFKAAQLNKQRQKSAAGQKKKK